MRRGVLRAASLAGALALAACAAPETAATAPVTPADLAARLPASAAGFQRGATLPLPQREQGREVAYATRGRVAAGAILELYRLAEGPVPPGAASPAAAMALAGLLDEALRAPGHRQQREVARLTLPLATEPRLACAETSGLYGRERVEGLLCAGGVGGGLLRLRVTMPQREPAPADPRAFATAILAALQAP
ncbi:hypothetical protein ACFQS7_26065 [Dankookia sp. GCM10030260]|uniref:hypothetical protein n=1 Tax=Dankookia sp. GCM10030260 TaxID=3273390 RepID=UPI00361150F2